jgi:hypothetical protein
MPEIPEDIPYDLGAEAHIPADSVLILDRDEHYFDTVLLQPKTIAVISRGPIEIDDYEVVVVSRYLYETEITNAIVGATTGVYVTTDSQWHDLTSVTKSSDSLWNVEEPEEGETSIVDKIITSEWHVAAIVDDTTTSEWHVHSIVDDTTVSEWNVNFIVDDTTTSEWHIYSIVDDSTDSEWDYLVRIAAEFSSEWHVDAIVEQDKE